MKEKTTKIYECDHCPKYYKRKHAAIKHEKYCRNNPANKHRCFEFCGHLSKVERVEECQYYDRKYKTFVCDITGDEMHSYIAERRGMEICDETERMPIKCENYKHEGEFSIK